MKLRSNGRTMDLTAAAARVDNDQIILNGIRVNKRGMELAPD